MQINLTALQFILIIVIVFNPNNAECFDAGTAQFDLKINGQKVEHNLIFRAVLGGEVLNFETKNADAKMVIDSETIDFIDKNLTWKAPDLPGHYANSIVSSNNTIVVNVFVMTPQSKVVNGHLGSFKIGNYPPPLKGLKAYKAPIGFIEVTQELSGLNISPHFKLGQFVSKQSSGYPKYVVLQPHLLEKLEFLLQKVNQSGIDSESFVIMSGYRTPFYNKSIGNVVNSQHVYGGAADIFIDSNPVDNYMDDLNSDGKISIEDSKHLYNLTDDFVKNTGRNHLSGGLGLYNSTSAHGPFIHVDVRGTKARW